MQSQYRSGADLLAARVLVVRGNVGAGAVVAAVAATTRLRAEVTLEHPQFGALSPLLLQRASSHWSVSTRAVAE